MAGSWDWVALLPVLLLGFAQSSPLPSPEAYDPRLSPLELSIIKSLVEALPGDNYGGGGTSEWSISSSRSRELSGLGSIDPGKESIFEVQSGEHRSEEGPNDQSLVHVALSELQPIGNNGRTQKDYRLSGEDESGGGSGDWSIVRSISTELHLRSKNHNQPDYQVPGGRDMILRDMQPPRVEVPISQPDYQLPIGQTQREDSNEWSTGYTLSRDEQAPSYEDPASQSGFQFPVEQTEKGGSDKWTQDQSKLGESYPTGIEDFEKPADVEVYQVPGKEMEGGSWNAFPGGDNAEGGVRGWETERSDEKENNGQFLQPGEQERRYYDIDIRMSAEVADVKKNVEINRNQNQGSLLPKGKSILNEIQPPERDEGFRNQKSYSSSGTQEDIGGGTNYNVVPEPARELQPAYDDLGEIPAGLREMLPPAEEQGEVTRGSWIAVPLEGAEGVEERSIGATDTSYSQECEPGHRLIMNVCRKVYSLQLTRVVRKPNYN